MSGFALDDMTRDHSWRFLMIGRSVERLQLQTAVIGHVLHGEEPIDVATLSWLLELGNSTITYRTRYLASPQLYPVLDLLLLDVDNPHAMVFQLDRLLDTLRQSGYALADDDALSTLPTRLRGADLAALADAPDGSARAALLDLLERAGHTLRELSERLMLRHFAHVVDVSQSTLST